MNRRGFLHLAAAGMFGSAPARAQQPKLVIGFLNSQSPGPWTSLVAAFRQGLRETGYAEGGNLAIEYRWAEGHADRLPQMAAELVRRQVAVIAATGGPAPALAAKQATATTPIVFNVGGDPVALGLVASLNRPGGNLTGFNILTSELDGKRLGMLREIGPTVGDVAVLINPRNPNAEQHDAAEAAQALNQRLTVLHASNDAEIAAALSPSGIGGAGALLVGADPFYNDRRAQIVERIAGLKLPAIYELRGFADAGGLMSYGANLADGYRTVGILVGRVLNGEKPADLPVQQSTKFELVINLKTAKALGLAVPQVLLAQADEVIE